MVSTRASADPGKVNDMMKHAMKYTLEPACIYFSSEAFAKDLLFSCWLFLMCAESDFEVVEIRGGVFLLILDLDFGFAGGLLHSASIIVSLLETNWRSARDLTRIGWTFGRADIISVRGGKLRTRRRLLGTKIKYPILLGLQYSPFCWVDPLKSDYILHYVR